MKKCLLGLSQPEAHLPVDGPLQGHSMVKHTMLEEVQHALIAPDAIGQPNCGPVLDTEAFKGSREGRSRLHALRATDSALSWTPDDAGGQADAAICASMMLSNMRAGNIKLHHDASMAEIPHDCNICPRSCQGGNEATWHVHSATPGPWALSRTHCE